MDNELMHHGVKGMKWGVRRRSKAHEDYAKAHSRKRVSEMSNQELRDRNNRLQMEQQYRDLKSKANRGNRAVSTFIKTAGTITATVAAYGVYKKYGNQILDKIGDLVVSGINLKGPLH